MNDKPNIPIKNIYYMLCYAWDCMEKTNDILFGSEKFDNIYNLFARIYVKETNSLIKRGLSKYYIRENEEVSTLKGKINVVDSLKAQTMLRGRMVCQYDDFSENILLNQIVKTTINLLIKSPNLDVGLQKKLLRLKGYFLNIQEIRLSKSIFPTVRFNRNNSHYRMLINISELLFKGLITNKGGNNILFANFLTDNQMAKLYEKFVLKFYRFHLNQELYYVHAPKLKWNLDENLDKEEVSLLPEMRTDIVIENKSKKTQLIIDTKYYAQTLVSSNWTDSEKVRTGHLYQIFAYIHNSDYSGNINGMLLYPTIEKEINARFPIGGKSISIKTLNLNTEWTDIRNRLLSLVN